MGVYGATGVKTSALNVGDNIQLVTAADTAAGNLKASQAVAITQGCGGSVEDGLTIYNATNQTATIQVATSDTNASYMALTNGNTSQAITCASGAASFFSFNGPLLRVSFAAAPTSGTLTIVR